MTYQWLQEEALTPVVELRNYRLAPGRRDRYIARFEEELIAPQEAVGAHVLGSFTLESDPDRFVWLRGFSHLAIRRVALESFYGGTAWRAARGAAETELVDGGVDLLRTITPAEGLVAARRERQPGPPLRHTLLVSELRYPEWVGTYHLWLRLFLRKAGADPLASFATVPAENNYPAQPVTNRQVHVALLRSAAPLPALPRELGNMLRMPPQTLVLTPTRRSRLR